MKISARDHFAAVDEDHRIIGSAIDLGLHDARDIAKGVAHRPVDLRHAAKRVAVLHAVAILVGLSQLASGKELPQPARGLDLSAMRARVMNPRVESGIRSEERIERQSTDDVGATHEPLSLDHRVRQKRRDDLRSVDERQAVFRVQANLLEPGARERFFAGKPLAAIKRFALADQDERDMGERSEVPARAHRPFLWHDRVHPFVEHRHESVEGRWIDA